MTTKAAQTSEFILATVAPIFNRNGYAATSMSEITKATGLTKGAIYGNFRNKEELAMAAFTMTVKTVLRRISEHLKQTEDPVRQLFLITDFYRNYYDYSQKLGGCPIVNMGIDANHQNPKLLQHVQHTISRIQKNIAKIITAGQEQRQIRAEIDALTYAKDIYMMINGAIFTTYTMQDTSYITVMMNRMDQMIREELIV